MNERGERRGLERHMAAVVEALVEHQVVQEFLEVEVCVGRAFVVERQHADDRADQRREVDALAAGLEREPEREPVGPAALQRRADLHGTVVQAIRPAQVDVDAPALGAEPRHRLGNEGERLALAVGADRVRRPGSAGKGAVERLGAAREAQVVQLVERLRAACGKAIVQPRLERARALKRHHNVAVAEGRVVVGEGTHEAAAVVEVEPERRQHEGRADHAPATATLPRGQPQQTQDRRRSNPLPRLGAHPLRGRRRGGERTEGLGDSSGGLGRDVRRRKQRQRQPRRRLEREQPEGAAGEIDIAGGLDGKRDERRSIRVHHAGSLASVLVRRPDQPPLARSAVAERPAVDVLPSSSPGGGDHREEIENLARLRRAPRGAVEGHLIQPEEVDPAQDALVDPTHEFRRLGPVEPRGVVAAGGLADRTVLAKGRLHRRDRRPAGGLDVDDVDEPVAHALRTIVVFPAGLRRVRRPNLGQPGGDCRRQADDCRGGCGKRRLAVRQGNEGGGDMLAVPPDRAVAMPVYPSEHPVGPGA